MKTRLARIFFRGWPADLSYGRFLLLFSGFIFGINVFFSVLKAALGTHVDAARFDLVTNVLGSMAMGFFVVLVPREFEQGHWKWLRKDRALPVADYPPSTGDPH